MSRRRGKIELGAGSLVEKQCNILHVCILWDFLAQINKFSDKESAHEQIS